MPAQAKILIQFFFQSQIALKGRKRLKAFLSQLLSKKGRKKSGKLRVIFCSDEELLQINRDYLNHDYYTDIITFPFTDAKDQHIDAELYISTDRVRENATRNKTTVEKELHRVIFHGCLHLCGLKDKSGKERNEMRKAEDQLLKKYFIVPRFTVSP